MIRILLGLIPSVLAVLGASQDATAQPKNEVKVSGNFSTMMASTYVFRGIPQYGRKTDPSVQFTAGLSVKNLGPGTLSLSLWNATSMLSYAEQGGTQLEFDLTVAYTMSFSKLNVGAGYIAYVLPENSVVDAGHELYGTLSYSGAWFTPFTQVYVDPIRQKGIYWTSGVRKSVPIGPLSISISGSAGFSSYPGSTFGLNDVSGLLGLTYNISAAVWASVSANASYLGGVGIGSVRERLVGWGSLSFGFSI